MHAPACRYQSPKRQTREVVAGQKPLTCKVAVRVKVRLDRLFASIQKQVDLTLCFLDTAVSLPSLLPACGCTVRYSLIFVPLPHSPCVKFAPAGERHIKGFRRVQKSFPNPFFSI